MTYNDINSDILKKLLLLQNSIWEISTLEKLYEFLKIELLDVPGVEKINFYTNSNWKSDRDFLLKEEMNSRRYVIFDLNTAEKQYGFCQIFTKSSQEFEKYVPYIENFFSFCSKYLENQENHRKINNNYIKDQFITNLMNSSMILSQVNLNGEYLFVNEYVSKLFNLKPDKLIGINFKSLIEPNNAELFMKRIAEIIQNQKPMTVFDNFLIDGKKHLFESILFPIFDDKNNLYSIGSVGIDITDTKNMQSVFRKSEDINRVLISVISNGVWIWNKDLNIIEWDQECFRLLGYPPKKTPITLEEWQNLIHEEDRDMFFSQLNIQILKTGQFHIEYRLKNSNDCYIWVECRGGLLTGSSEIPNLVIGIHIDISKHKQAEQERNNYQIQLLQTQKLESLGSLASGIAHDFNNLLTVIKGYSELLIDEITNPEASEKVELIQTAADRAIGLTSQLLAYSRKQLLHKERISVGKIIDHLLKMLNRVIGENIEIQYHNPRKDIYIWADPTQFEQVIMNILINARDAMPNGGLISISINEIEFTSELIKENELSKPGEYVQIDISDTGEGMTEEVLKRLFEPFFSTKAKGKGTGLGLSVVDGIIKQHKGAIRVKSKINEGTTFTIYLPKNIEEISVIDSKTNNAINSNNIQKYESNFILLIEDQNEVRNFIQKVLSSQGYLLSSYNLAEEAFKEFQKNSNKFDLVISDLQLPKKDGIWLIKEIRKVNKEKKIIIISGHTGNEEEQRFIKENNLQFLQKPFTIEDLILKVKFILSDMHLLGEELNNG